MNGSGTYHAFIKRRVVKGTLLTIYMCLKGEGGLLGNVYGSRIVVGCNVSYRCTKFLNNL